MAKKFQLSLNEEEIIKRKANEIVNVLRKNTPVDTGKARDGWRFDGKRIVNDVPYIDKLNRGTSKQAPPYFIESAALSVGQVVPNGTIVEET